MLDFESTSALAFSPDDRFLVSGSSDGNIAFWDISDNSPNYGKSTKIIDVKPNCNGMQISGAIGLEQEMTWMSQGNFIRGSKLEYIAQCGAVLDKEQQKLLKRQLPSIRN